MVSLLTPREASEFLSDQLGVEIHKQTAYRRIKAAARRGDPGVRRVGKIWCASREWWLEEFHQRPPLQRGRPPKQPI